MGRSWDESINDASNVSHAQWKERLFMKVIRLRLRSPPPAGTNEEVRDPEHYELNYPVVPDELDDDE